MAKYLLTWELGGGLGHIMHLHTVSQCLLDAGHQVFAAIKDLSHSKLLTDLGVPCFQAPQLLLDMDNANGSPNSFAEILYRRGYSSPASLECLIESWHSLLNLISPDVVICDSSPTSLLAAKTFGYHKTIAIASSFFLPTTDQINSVFRQHSECNQDNLRLKTISDSVLNSVNLMSKQKGGEQFGKLEELFYGCKNYLFTVPELDYSYQRTCEFSYIGNTGVVSDTKFDSNFQSYFKEFNKTNNKIKNRKIFVYLKNEYKSVEVILNQLGSVDAEIVIYLSGEKNTNISKYTSSNVSIHCQPINIDLVLRDADLVISHAGCGLITSALMVGVPLLLLPISYEQFLNAKRAEDIGIARIVRQESRLNEYINRILEDQNIKNSSKELSDKYKKQETEEEKSSMNDHLKTDAKLFDPSIF